MALRKIAIVTTEGLWIKAAGAKWGSSDHGRKPASGWEAQGKARAHEYVLTEIFKAAKQRRFRGSQRWAKKRKQRLSRKKRGGSIL